MAVFYNKMQRKNPSKPAEPAKWYPVLRRVEMMKEKDVARHISDETNTNTTLVETEYKSYDLHHGVFIDIFPIDGYIKGQDKMLDFRIKERAFEEPTGIKRIYSSIVSGNQAIMTIRASQDACEGQSPLRERMPPEKTLLCLYPTTPWRIRQAPSS